MSIDYQVSDGIAYVRICRPEKANAINLPMRFDLIRAWQQARQDPAVRVLVVAGTGPYFSAGKDLKEALTDEEKASDPHTKVYTELLRVEKPVIASINGICYAQGAGLALLSDIRIASENATFGWPQIKRGIGSVSGPALLSRMIPRNIALQYLFTGDSFDVDEAVKWGIVNHAVPESELDSHVDDFARKLAAKPPLALRAIKDATVRAQQLSQLEAVEMATAVTATIVDSEDAVEGRTAFREKRSAAWEL